MKDKIPTQQQYVNLPVWMVTWLKANTKDNVTKEIRRAIKEYIDSRERLKILHSIPNQ